MYSDSKLYSADEPAQIGKRNMINSAPPVQVVPIRLCVCFLFPEGQGAVLQVVDQQKYQVRA